MAHTRRYWDGNAWTDHIAPALSGPDPQQLRRIALFIGLLLLAPVLVVTLIPPSVAGESCGTWISPRFTDAEVAVLQSRVGLQGGGALEAAQIQALANTCEDRLATRRTIAFALLGVGIVLRYAIPRLFGGGAQGARSKSEVRTYHPLAGRSLGVGQAVAMGAAVVLLALVIAGLITSFT